MDKKILHLPIEWKWFYLIMIESKKLEYREIKPYWTKRLFKDGKMVQFDEVWFRNGYNSKAPFMKVEWKGMHQEVFRDKLQYAIELGKVMAVENV